MISIPGGRTAFAARVLLARQAARSIDIQTYIWRADATGSMLFNEMLQAAQRGVRVRLLLDDANTNRQIDTILAMLAAQPGIEVRLYNPFVSRGSRALGFLGDFGRLNHRMHNKAYIVDSQVAIVGGRNLADEYFEATEDTTHGRSRCDGRRRGRAHRVRRFRPVLEQPLGLPGGRDSRRRHAHDA